MTVFLDTVGILALWDTSDQWHRLANDAYVRLVARRADFATTSYVLLEVANAAARRPYRVEVDRLRQALAAAGNLIEPTAADANAAWEGYRRGDGGDAGIVDQFSFAAMRRLAITEAFTNDRHFAAAGFTTLF